VGAGGEPDWRIRPKRRPVSRRYRIGTLGVVGGLGALPYVEELVRCMRYRTQASR
jgi:hypothetical protein